MLLIEIGVMTLFDYLRLRSYMAPYIVYFVSFHIEWAACGVQHHFDII